MVDEDELVKNAGDRAASLDDRFRSIQSLGESDSDVARKALIDLSSSSGEATSIAEAAGVALANQYFRRGDLVDAPLHEFTTEAGEAFDQEAGRLLRGVRPSE